MTTVTPESVTRTSSTLTPARAAATRTSRSASSGDRRAVAVAASGRPVDRDLGCAHNRVAADRHLDVAEGALDGVEAPIEE